MAGVLRRHRRAPTPILVARTPLPTLCGVCTIQLKTARNRANPIEGSDDRLLREAWLAESPEMANRSESDLPTRGEADRDAAGRRDEVDLRRMMHRKAM